MEILSEQELHNLAMNVVGKDLEAKGFEFIAVNSKLKKDPQFVCLKNKKLHFVVVKAVLYPENPKEFDVVYMEIMREHALKFKARTYYAGVGIANAENYEEPVVRDRNYVINYDGIQEIV
ncbi:Na(+)-translocating NADH-quinone reductase subunit F [Sinomicrobium pectinilyticum]|uniref:Na(+)-translocating NADH-quinone reductase subunit F n=1 Tax=Sinomicrobium pectinilyticum TaxID=1084421 RepID=A0A3N0F537_SINP1|nr:Na(+)-translocating NADH-quinone reductase subunit F [Sinomicrobium pectinilyticum]RNL95234.1 Na(+)-translocating NADH-quinone reductase subunit F [Sinomicrobium pectinilyticum]